MKKLFFTLATSLLFVANSLAQNSFAAFAALEHNGALTTFSGSNALAEAIKAADDGDVITLSAGSFSNYQNNSINVTKSITLRGAGIDVNDGKNYTTITYNGSSNLNFDYETNPNLSVTLEGIDFQGGISSGSGVNNNGQLNITKCIIMAGCQSNAKNTKIVSSKIFWLDANYDDTFTKCYNSVIIYADSPIGTTYTNCIVYGPGNGTYENCICADAHSGSNNGYFNLCVANHCVLVDISNDYTPSFLNTDITVVENWSDVFNYEGENEDFKTYDPDFCRMQNFEPRLEYSLMGIYAGLMPYSPVLDLPSIKSITVAKQSDNDGKLSIDVEIED